MRPVRIVDYFAGAGGFTEGATQAGATVVCAINHWPVAVAAHAANHPHITHHCEDLTRFDPRRLPTFDVLVGGFACQGFGDAKGSGNRKRTKVKKTAEDLQAKWDADRATAWSVIDCAEIRRPRGIIVENIPKFLRWTLFPRWLGCLEDLGYGVRVQVVNGARWVAQDRPRVIITAVHKGEAPAVAEPDAPETPISSVIDFGAGDWTPVEGHVPATLARVARGRAAFGDRFVMPYNGSGSGLTGRSLDRPIGTITSADRWGVVDGDRMRMLRVEEIRAAMGFRADYQLPPQRDRATALLGNAIIPAKARAAVSAMMKAVA